jgi:hypothetical protein
MRFLSLRVNKVSEAISFWLAHFSQTFFRHWRIFSLDQIVGYSVLSLELQVK